MEVFLNILTYIVLLPTLFLAHCSCSHPARSSSPAEDIQFRFKLILLSLRKRSFLTCCLQWFHIAVMILRRDAVHSWNNLVVLKIAISKFFMNGESLQLFTKQWLLIEKLEDYFCLLSRNNSQKIKLFSFRNVIL